MAFTAAIGYLGSEAVINCPWGVLEIEMVGASQPKSEPLSVEAFRNWVASRPDEERWELVAGVPMMMAPPTRDHQRIASNLERLLNDAIERLPSRTPGLAAYQRIGVNLGRIIQDYDPEPDVAVVEVAKGADPRYADRLFLAAEVVSQSDLPTVEGKRELYKRHPDCNCVLVIQQDRYEVKLDARTQDGWIREKLSSPDDQLVLPEFGLKCSLADIYKGTMGAA
jgi:Uma2 family endonuclease